MVQNGVREWEILLSIAELIKIKNIILEVKDKALILISYPTLKVAFLRLTKPTLDTWEIFYLVFPNRFISRVEFIIVRNPDYESTNFRFDI